MHAKYGHDMKGCYNRLMMSGMGAGNEVSAHVSGIDVLSLVQMV